MVFALLPSEIARLILNYLEEQNLQKTYDAFLNECKHLTETKEIIRRGITVTKTIHGKTLTDFLVFNPKDAISTVSVSTQTELIPLFQETSNTDPNATNNVSQSPDSELKTDQVESTAQDVTQQAERKRILIGKNVEKIPKFSVSVLERQLESIINDPANQIIDPPPESTPDIIFESEKVFSAPQSSITIVPKSQPNAQFGNNVVQGAPLLLNTSSAAMSSQLTKITTSLGTFLIPSQNSPIRNISTGGSAAAGLVKLAPSFLPSATTSSSTSLNTQVFTDKTHLTNAIQKASPNRALKSKPQMAIKKSSPNSSNSKITGTKRVYNRIAPTIRAMLDSSSAEGGSQSQEVMKKSSGEDSYKDVFEQLDLSCVNAVQTSQNALDWESSKDKRQQSRSELKKMEDELDDWVLSNSKRRRTPRIGQDPSALI